MTNEFAMPIMKTALAVTQAASQSSMLAVLACTVACCVANTALSAVPAAPKYQRPLANSLRLALNASVLWLNLVALAAAAGGAATLPRAAAYSALMAPVVFGVVLASAILGGLFDTREKEVLGVVEQERNIVVTVDEEARTDNNTTSPLVETVSKEEATKQGTLGARTPARSAFDLMHGKEKGEVELVEKLSLVQNRAPVAEASSSRTRIAAAAASSASEESAPHPFAVNSD